MIKSEGENKSLRLHVSPKAEGAIRGGHPWLFSDSIREQNREGKMGELAILYGRHDEFLAIGLYDSGSPMRVRVLHAGKPVPLNDAWWSAHLRKALEKRLPWFGPETTGYRLIHGENDGWPGLVLDRYGDVGVLKLYSSIWFERLPFILKTLSALIRLKSVVLRLSRNVQSYLIRTPDLSWGDGRVIYGEPVVDRVIFMEHGLRFEADVLKGQKTGFFLDQRENRLRVGALSKGRKVLNAFSFSGAFSLYAAQGGARQVTDLDISEHALESARRNFKLNLDLPGVRDCRHMTLQKDAFEWFKLKEGDKYGLIILDPPSLAKREVERARAIDAYGKLAENAVQHLSGDGELVAASCSAHVTSTEFFGAIEGGLRRAGRKFKELARSAHPPDHPSAFPEGAYLKCLFLTVH